MTNDRIDQLLALAALGELDEGQEAELDAALAADAELSGELDADLATAAEVQSTLAEEPPPSLKTSILAALDDVPQDRTPPATPGTATPRTASSDAAPPVTSITAAPSRRRTPQIVAAAAAVVLVMVGGLVVFSRTATAPTDVAAVVSADDAIERPLSGSELTGLAVVFSPSQNAFVLIGTDIPVLTDDETYQLWLVGPDGARSVGTFRPDDDGDVAERFDDRDPSEFVVGVTIEPAGGSETPTEPIRAATTA